MEINNVILNSDIYFNIKKSAFDFIEKYYIEPHRFYHNKKHIEFMINKLSKVNISHNDKIAIYIAILFHDVIYNPKDRDENNVIKSSELFIFWYEKNIELFYHLQIKELINQLILSTINHKPTKYFSTKFVDIANIFLDLDLMILASNKKQYDKYKNNIFKEYSHFERKELLKGRLDFICKMLDVESIFKYFINLNQLAKNNLMREKINIEKELYGNDKNQ